MRASLVFAFIRLNLNKIEVILILAAIIGASVTLILGGSVKPDTIRIIDVSALASPPYGESNSGMTVGYNENYSKWIPSSNAQISSSPNSLVVTGSFLNVSTWTSATINKAVALNITSYPLLNVDLSLTVGVRYGIRFFAQYPNGTAYNVWSEDSPLDHRTGSGNESLRINMQRQAHLATGHIVSMLTRMEIYVEDPPNSPQSFRFVLSKFWLESDLLEQASAGQFRAIYFDLRSAPQSNESWALNKVNLGMTIKATQDMLFSIYIFEGFNIYSSTTATGLAYNSATSFSEYTFYPDSQQQIFPELLPKSNISIVLVVTSGILQSATLSYADFIFLPTTIAPNLSQQSLGLYYAFFIFFLFLLPLGLAILVFREFFSRNLTHRASMVGVLVTGLLCRVVLAATTAHVVDMNVYLTSIRGWFQYGIPNGSLGPTLPLTFPLYWLGYSPYAALQALGFQDANFLGHQAGILESVFVKLFPILTDTMIFLVLPRFKNDAKSFVWATFYFLNPLAIFVSSVWGQYDAATIGLTMLGTYWLTRRKTVKAGLFFVFSGLIELFGFIPYLFLLLRTSFEKKLTLTVSLLATLLLVFVYPGEVSLIIRLVLAFLNVTKTITYSSPGTYTIFGSSSFLGFVSVIHPLWLSGTGIVVGAIIQTIKHKFDTNSIILFSTLSAVSFLLFSRVLASWVWLLPLGIGYAILTNRDSLAAFTLVLGTGIAFVMMSYAFGSAYLLLGKVGYPILPSVEAIGNGFQIFVILVAILAGLFLLYLRRPITTSPQGTLIRMSVFSIGLYLLLYFWIGVYPW